MSLLEAKVLLRRPGLVLEAELDVGEGVTALFGPSGAGKTTLLQCVAGLVRPDRGRIVLAGRTLFDAESRTWVAPERRGVGVVFQDLRLFPHLTVEENLRFGWRGDRTERPLTLPRVLELLELGPLRARRPPTLSGGEARRLAIGRALLASPRLLLLDEPLGGLDEARKAAVIGLLGQIRAEFALPMLLVSHSLPEILQLTTRIAVLEGGRSIGQGELHEVLGSDRVFRLAERLGLESVVEVTLGTAEPEAGLTRARLGSVELALPPVERVPGTRALVAVRAEDVILARGPVPGISAQNALPGTISRITRLSDRLLVSVDVGGADGGTLRAEITARAERELAIAPGATVVCLVKTLAFRWRRFLD